jgi:uncharacterized Zn finger protein (UPF0148 family)
VSRCPKCRYALMRDGSCPICDGRKVSDRLPMAAPLPLGKDDPRVLTFARKQKHKRRSA